MGVKNSTWYALTANPIIYVSLVEQFWQTATVKTLNDGEQQITVIVDGHKFAITEAYVRKTSLWVHVPLFDTMLLHDQPGQGEGPTLSVESQHTPTASSPSTSQPTTSQPTSSQAQSSHEPTTEPIITTSSPHSQETQNPQTTSSMPHDSPLPGITSKRQKLKKLRLVHERPLPVGEKVTKDEESLSLPPKEKGIRCSSYEGINCSEGSLSKRRLMRRDKICRCREENAGVGYDFDLSEQQVTPLKAPQVELQSQETFEAELRFPSMPPKSCRSIHKRSDPYLKKKQKGKTSCLKESDVEMTKKKRVAKEALLQESFKKLRTTQALGSEAFQEQSTEETKEFNEEDLKTLLEIVPVEEFRVEALQINFEDMLKAFDKEDLDTLWSLVKEKFRSVEPTEDITSCIFNKRTCIYMLPEKDYPLTTEVMMLMLSRRLQVEEDSEMARDLLKKIFIEANRSRR
ncbi:hypothetical protein Tco_0738851 [Tanacetum coccineum]